MKKHKKLQRTRKGRKTFQQLQQKKKSQGKKERKNIQCAFNALPKVARRGERLCFTFKLCHKMLKLKVTRRG